MSGIHLEGKKGVRGRVLALCAAVVAAAVLAVGVPTAAMAVQGGIAQAQKNSVEPKASDIWTRLGGNTALGTMKKIVDEGWASSDYAIVATMSSYHDALSASGLAGLLECPVMLTASDNLSAQTKALLKSKKVKRVVVVGGPRAVSDKVLAQLRSVSGVEGVERVAGATASGTARAIYNYGKKHGGWGGTGDAVLATSRTYQDALSIAPYAYAKKAPVFLTAAGKTTVDGATSSAISGGGFARTLVVGGYKAVDASADSAVVNARRLAGATAYGTSRAVAKFSIESGMEVSHMGVARGDGYHDAVCGAALCGKNNSVIILADDNNKYADIRDTCIAGIVDAHRADLRKSCYVFGGTEAVSVPVWNRLVGDGTVPVKKEIDFSGASLDTPEGGYTYDGTEKRPGVIGMQPAGLVEGTDYVLVYTDCTDPGTGAVSVIGIGDYEGSSKIFTFEIDKADISGATVVLDCGSFPYDASPHKPAVSQVTLGGRVLVEGVDYVVEVQEQTGVGDYAVSVTGVGAYEGVVENVRWQITASTADLSKLSVELPAAERVYNGAAICPEPSVAYDGRALAQGVDYDLSWANNVDASDFARVTVTLKGGMSGEKSVDFTIGRADLAGAAVELEKDELTYEADAKGSSVLQRAEVKAVVPADGAKAPAAGDYTVSGDTGVTCGDYTLKVEGVGNYKGSATATWKIVPRVLTSAELAGARLEGADGLVYDGQAKEPDVTGLPAGLVESVDYEVSYANNTDATAKSGAKATATIEFKGNYAGTPDKELSFEIGQADLAGASVYLDGTRLVYNGSAQQKKVASVVAADGRAVPADAYAVAGDTQTDVRDGGYTLTVTGTGNYKGTATAAWSIAPAAIDLSRAAVDTSAAVVYDGTERKPGVTGLEGYVAGTDYDVSYKNNVNAGTATATVTLKGNYTGTKSIDFQVKPYTLTADNASLTFANDGASYTGSVIQAGEATLELKAALAGGEKKLEASDFTLAGATSGTDAGSYSARAAGSGNYTGTCAGIWTIAQVDLPGSMKPTGLATTAETGQKLSEVALPALPEGYPGTLAWKDGTAAVSSSAGTYDYPAVFTSANTNYKPAEVQVSTTVAAVYTVVYHANGGTGPDQVQSIAVGKKSDTLKSAASMFSAPSGKRFAFWTLGTPDTKLTSVDSTVTTGVKNVTTLTYADGHNLSKPDGSADKSAAAVEMYTDSSTSTSKTEAATGDTVNLYAHWIDESLGSYWMAPSKKCTTATPAAYTPSAAAAATTVNAAYSSPETGDGGAAVYKDNAAVKSAVAALKAEIAAGTSTTLQDEWTTLMKADKYHLYTLYQEDRPLAFDERYVESRVVHVGAHGGDGTTLTFEAVYSLPTAYRMNSTGTNTGGWEASELRGKLLEGGAICANFEQGYLDDILKVNKYTIGGKDDTTVDTTSDKLWLLSCNEITGSTMSDFYEGDHGGQYAWYKALSIYQSQNSALVKGQCTRAEGIAASASADYYWWERSPYSSTANSFANATGYYGSASDYYSAHSLFGVRPACAM